MKQSQQHIVILGAGESGIGAALLAKAHGNTVFVSDQGKIKDAFKKELGDSNIEWEEGRHSEERILKADIIIKSPGIPNSSEFVKRLVKVGKQPIGEIEFAANFTKAKLICITGSNGKTTTTHLVHHVLKNGGLNVEMCGNMGVSFARKLIGEQADYYVLELSSFQLEDMYKFRADISVLLNITPDHLDRYENSMDLYGQAKMRITQNQTAEDFFIYNADDLEIKKQLNKNKVKAQKMPFSLVDETVEGGFMNEEQQIITIKNKLT
ncbi:MAG: Mur ligase family protein, partial [Brumimicrobium sp.]